ncbi:hypothetical protein B0G69_6894 [Paraburkholderia sp. RAU2J]|nr:hypothetical protein B0G69_6894 [Paraburkholderia sp. RAU2J]
MGRVGLNRLLAAHQFIEADEIAEAVRKQIDGIAMLRTHAQIAVTVLAVSHHPQGHQRNAGAARASDQPFDRRVGCTPIAAATKGSADSRPTAVNEAQKVFPGARTERVRGTFPRWIRGVGVF